MTDETVTATSPTLASLKSQYNRLVEQARGLEMTGYKPLQSDFKSIKVGEARVASLESSIKAREAGLAAEQRQPAASEVETQPTEEATMAKTARKATKVAKKKVAGNSHSKSKKAAASNARSKVKEVRDGIVGVFGTREGSKKEKLLVTLHNSKNKEVPVSDLLKAIYKKDEVKTPRGALGMVLQGLMIMIDEVNKKKTGKHYELVSDGRGDDATLTLRVS